MSRSVVIDCLPESALRYASGYAVVAIDVIRATTTAITGAALGRRVYPVPSIEAALPVAAVLHRPLLVGELGGNMPYGFDITNSPAQVAERRDVRRPMILLSSSGTQLIHNAAVADALYIASLRNLSATVRHLARHHESVAVIGAGTRGEFREEDQACAAWIAAGLLEAGFEPANPFTSEIVDRWRDIPHAGWLGSKSVEYLRRSDQLRDLDFILGHIDDLTRVFAVRDGEVVDAGEGRSRRRVSVPAIAHPRQLVEHE